MGASPEDAEDIIQDTLIKAYENIEIIESGKMKAWLFKVAINGFYSLYRKRKPVVNIDDELTERLCIEHNLDSHMSQVDLRIQIQEVFSKMKESQRALIILKYYLDLSYRDIGLLLNTSENTVKTLLYRSRQAFKELWEVE